MKLSRLKKINISAFTTFSNAIMQMETFHLIMSIWGKDVLSLEV